MRSLPFWRRKPVRRALVQTAFVAGVLAVLWLGATTAAANLARQGITSGYAFLWKATGWELNFALLGAEPDDPYWWFLLNGLVNTLFLGIIGLFFATLVGLAVGLARSARNAPARLLGSIYVEIFRNIPLIVQVFFWYAVSTRLPNPREAWEVGGALVSGRGIYVPSLNVSGAALGLAVALLLATLGLLAWLGLARRFRRMAPAAKRRALAATLLGGCLAAGAAIIGGHEGGTPYLSFPELAGLNIRGGLRIQPELYALAFAIALYGGAYIGEIVRGGFKSVGRGQSEAAQALGLTPWQAFSRIRLPLAFRAMLPILINQYVWLIKATTLGIAVGFSDFFMVVAGAITHSGQTLELIGVLMAGFLMVNLGLAALLNRLNRAIALKGHQNGAAQ